MARSLRKGPYVFERLLNRVKESSKKYESKYYYSSDKSDRKHRSKSSSGRHSKSDIFDESEELKAHLKNEFGERSTEKKITKLMDEKKNNHFSDIIQDEDLINIDTMDGESEEKIEEQLPDNTMVSEMNEIEAQKEKIVEMISSEEPKVENEPDSTIEVKEEIKEEEKTEHKPKRFVEEAPEEKDKYDKKEVKSSTRTRKVATAKKEKEAKETKKKAADKKTKETKKAKTAAKKTSTKTAAKTTKKTTTKATTKRAAAKPIDEKKTIGKKILDLFTEEVDEEEGKRKCDRG